MNAKLIALVALTAIAPLAVATVAIHEFNPCLEYPFKYYGEHLAATRSETHNETVVEVTYHLCHHDGAITKTWRDGA